MIDTHLHVSHLDAPQRAWQRAKQAGVSGWFAMANDPQSWRDLLALQNDIPFKLGLGLHPLCAHADQNQDLQQLAGMVSNAKLIGECGLDAGPTAPPLPLQIEALRFQIELAQTHQLPLSLHSYRAVDTLLKQLRLSGANCGIFHGFIGSEQQANAVIEQGFLIGVGGAITYPRAQRLRRVIVALPLETLVLETDAPYQPLMGFQGEANRPERLKIIADTIAELKQIDVKDVIKITTDNARKLIA